jgi:cell wall-associated NlpC family hydrolase
MTPPSAEVPNDPQRLDPPMGGSATQGFYDRTDTYPTQPQGGRRGGQPPPVEDWLGQGDLGAPPDDGISDPWATAPVVGEDPQGEQPGPNRWLVVGAALAAVAVLFLAFSLRGGSSEEPAAPTETTEATLPVQDTPDEPEPEPEVADGSVRSVRITPTGAPAGCIGQVSAATGSPPLERFLNAALAQQGIPYRFGAEVAGGATPEAFDSSELVQWAAGQAGVTISDGSWLQFLELQGCGTTTSVDEALATPGALVFAFSSEPVAGGERPSDSRVAISLGDGRVVEAAVPVVSVVDGATRGFTHGARIPDLGTGTAEYLP